MKEIPTIYITMEGGVIQGITFGAAEGLVRIQVHDYDTEGAAEEEITEDANGDRCIVSLYEHD